MKNTFLNVQEAVFANADADSDSIALIYEDTRITYGELRRRAAAVSEKLRSYGVGYGDRVAYSMRGCPEFFYTALACGIIGAVFVGIAFRSTLEAARVMIGESKPAIIVCERSAAGKFTEASDGKIRVITCEELIDGTDGTYTYKRDGRVDVSTPLFVLYTSGTTKKPKGAVLTHGNVLASAEMQNSRLFVPTGFGKNDIIQHCFPVNHVSGSVECGMNPLIGGGCIIVLPDFDPERILSNTEKYKSTVLCGVPAMWVKLFDVIGGGRYDLSSVRCCISGAAVLGEKMYFMMESICGDTENPLGMTEASGFTSYFPPDADRGQIRGSVGKIMPELEYKIIDADGNNVTKGEIGQLCYKGESIISRYLSEELPTDGDGFFASGDLAYEDENGFIYLSGRNDDMFTVGGYNVYPQEIEDVLMSYPGVTGAAVLPIPHHSMGSVCRAYITVSEDVDSESLESFASGRLIYYKVPKNYVILDKFPVNALGKVSRKTLALGIKEEFGL